MDIELDPRQKAALDRYYSWLHPVETELGKLVKTYSDKCRVACVEDGPAGKRTQVGEANLISALERSGQDFRDQYFGRFLNGGGLGITIVGLEASFLDRNALPLAGIRTFGSEEEVLVCVSCPTEEVENGREGRVKAVFVMGEKDATDLLNDCVKSPDLALALVDEKRGRQAEGVRLRQGKGVKIYKNGVYPKETDGWASFVSEEREEEKEGDENEVVLQGERLQEVVTEALGPEWSLAGLGADIKYTERAYLENHNDWRKSGILEPGPGGPGLVVAASEDSDAKFFPLKLRQAAAKEVFGSPDIEVKMNIKVDWSDPDGVVRLEVKRVEEEKPENKIRPGYLVREGLDKFIKRALGNEGHIGVTERDNELGVEVVSGELAAVIVPGGGAKNGIRGVNDLDERMADLVVERMVKIAAEELGVKPEQVVFEPRTVQEGRERFPVLGVKIRENEEVMVKSDEEKAREGLEKALGNLEKVGYADKAAEARILLLPLMSAVGRGETEDVLVEMMKRLCPDRESFDQELNLLGQTLRSIGTGGYDAMLSVQGRGSERWKAIEATRHLVQEVGLDEELQMEEKYYAFRSRLEMWVNIDKL